MPRVVLVGGNSVGSSLIINFFIKSSQVIRPLTSNSSIPTLAPKSQSSGHSTDSSARFLLIRSQLLLFFVMATTLTLIHPNELHTPSTSGVWGSIAVLTSTNLSIAIHLPPASIFCSIIVFLALPIPFPACFHLLHYPFHPSLVRSLLRKRESTVEAGRHSVGHRTGTRYCEYKGAYCSGSRYSRVLFRA